MAKKSRKQLLKQDDVFITTAGQGLSWVREHRRPVLVGSVAVVVAVTAALLSSWYVGELRVRGSAELRKAYDLLDAKVLPEDSDQAADPTGDPPTFASEEDKRSATRDAFLAVIKAGGEDGPGVFARFYLAQIDLDDGKAEAAEQAFLTLANELGPRDSLYFLALERAAYLQETRGDLDAAIKTLEPLAGAREAFYADRAAFHRARMLAEKGETDKARAILVAMQSDFPESSTKNDVDAMLKDLGPAPSENLASATEKSEDDTGAGREASE